MNSVPSMSPEQYAAAHTHLHDAPVNAAVVVLDEQEVQSLNDPVTRHAALAQQAVDQRLVMPCPLCGLTSIVQAYAPATLICALRGTVTLDPMPTHQCKVEQEASGVQSLNKVACSPVMARVDRWRGDAATIYTPPEGVIEVPACTCGRLLTTDTGNLTADTLRLLADAEDCRSEWQNLRSRVVNMGGAW